MTVSPREKILLYVLGLLVILLAGTKFLAMPAFDRLSADETRLSQLRTQADLAAIQLAQAKNLPAAKNKALTQAAGASAALLPTMENDQLSIWFYRMTQRSGLMMLSIRFSDATAVDVRSLLSASSGSAGTSGSAGQSTGSASGTMAPEPAYLLRQYVRTYRGEPASPADKTSGGGSAGFPHSLLAKTVSLEVSGPAAGVEELMDNLRLSGRTVRVTAYSSSASGRGGATVATLTLQAFGTVKPDSDRLS